MAEPFERPAWLGATPHSSYFEYGTHASEAWNSIPLAERNEYALYYAHVNALRGSKKDLRAMKQFYLNLTTLRLKR